MVGRGTPFEEHGCDLSGVDFDVPLPEPLSQFSGRDLEFIMHE